MTALDRAMARCAREIAAATAPADAMQARCRAITAPADAVKARLRAFSRPTDALKARLQREIEAMTATGPAAVINWTGAEE